MILILLTIALGIISGIIEGIVMTKFSDPMHGNEFQEGVRGHRWFKWYHQIRIIVWSLFAALSIMIWTNPPRILTIIGISILLWECREVGYNYARYMTVLAGTENVFGLGKEIQRTGVIIIHGTRTVLSLMFLYGGMV